MIRTYSGNADAGRTRKTSRAVQISSSPPLFITTSRSGASRPRAQRLREAGSAEPSSTSSPRAIAKRSSAVRRRDSLELRPSLAASPFPSGLQVSRKQLELSRAPTRSNIGQHAFVEAHSGAHDTNRGLLQRNRQLNHNDSSSPIGTFGGPLIGCPDRGLQPSHFGSSDSASMGPRSNLVGPQASALPAQLETHHRTRTPRLRWAQSSNTNGSENTDALIALGTGQGKRSSTKRPAEDNVSRPRKRRPRIQRVQLGRTLPTSSAEQPLGDVGHQLNSQPDTDECCGAADESEIIYFPTLPPACLDPGDEPNTRTVAEQSISVLDRSFLSTSTPIASKAKTQIAQEDESRQWNDDSLASERDSSLGLLEVLSQSAMRRFDHVQPAKADYLPRPRQITPTGVTAESSQSTKLQPQVQVEFDSRHSTHAQAQRIVALILKSRLEPRTWSPVHPDVIPKRSQGPMRTSLKAHTSLQAPLRPPSKRAVCRDLGLSLTQLLRGPSVELSDFVHYTSTACVEHIQLHDQEELEPFEHGLRFAGYRLAYANQAEETVHPGVEGNSIPFSQAFNTHELRERMQSRRKEVVKVIVPFSEPSLSPRATRARFLTPQHDYSVPAPLRCPTTLRLDEDVLLVWMQSTARKFLHALEDMLQAGSTRSAQAEPYGLDASELDLYPCPILHYVPHVGIAASALEKATKDGSATRDVNAGYTLSHVALYVHLDRIGEARRKLAAFELGDTQRERCSYRPFSDSLVRLLVTSLRGEPLCLI